MLKLEPVSTEPFWFNSMPGVRIRFRPVSVAATLITRGAVGEALQAGGEQATIEAGAAFTRTGAHTGIVAWEGIGGRCQTKRKASEIAPSQPSSGRAKVPPLGQSGGSAILECLPVDQGAFRVEVIVDRAVQRGKVLQTSHPPEAEHRPFPSPERLMAVLRPVVQPASRLALASRAQSRQGHPVGRQPIRDDCFGATMPAQYMPTNDQHYNSRQSDFRSSAG
jgi:hypothetical protein